MPETIQTETTKPLDLTKCSPKTLAQLRMMENGVDALTALQLTNNKTNISPVTHSKLKTKYRRYSLQAPKMVKLAHDAVKDCLTDQPIINVKRDKDGNEISEAISPTWTNKIAAASMVMDRYEPVITKSQSLNVTVEASPVDLSRWLNQCNELSTDSKNNVSTQDDKVIDVDV